jgi:hypothetical protein
VGSRYYIERLADEEFARAVARRDGLIQVRAATRRAKFLAGTCISPGQG